MTKAARPAIERLSEHLRKAPHLNEIKSIQLTYRWVARVGGLDGLDWLLIERDLLGLDDLELTNSQAVWMSRLRALVARAIYDRQLARERRQIPTLTHVERRARIMQRKVEDDRRRLAIYDHVPKPQRKLSVHERMAAAWERLNAA